MLRTLTVSKRLNFVNGLFAVGLLIIGGLGLWVQWNAMRAQRAEALTTLTRYAAAAIDHERADAEKNNLSEDVAKAHALAAIAAMRDGPDGYFSVANENGVLLYHPDLKVVGTDMTKVADSNGFHFVADVIPRTIRDGSATVWYSFPRVGSTTPVTKLTAYVYYKPWHWLISTGTYMDTMYADFWQSAGKLLLVGLLMLITIYGLVMLVIRSIVRPLLSINRAMGAVASGRLDIDVPEAKFGGEIGAMGAAVVTFRDAGVEKRRLEMEAEATQTRLEADRARQAEIEAAAAQQQQFVVSELAGGLARLANGDLTSHLSQPFSPEYEALRTDYNRAVAQLHATIGAIIANIGNLRSGAGEITNAADDLSRRTEQQAASLEETAAALDEVTATVKKAAEGARQARDLVATTKTGAEKSGQVVRDAIGAMSAIENSATQITQIIGVIDEIAFQTNLLALNAGVEAARAGDAGRGFAVVASEVRALAQRSAQAAKEIKALISSSTQHVGQGVNLVGATGTSLTDIVTQIGKINNLITEIAGSSEEQATALHQVNTAINQMDQVTQQNAAMVEQSTAASHSLSEDSETLLQLISKFRVADAAEPGKIVRFAKPARTERVMAAAPPQRSRTGSRPAVAAKDASVRNSDRWQEF